jgi:hypothetical protein
LPVYPLLALLWAMVLVPPMFRRRARHRSEFPEFDRVRLSVVGAVGVAGHERHDPSPPPVRRTATERRRRVLALIGIGMVATLAVALVVGTRLTWGIHLLSYDILIAYVGLLARSRDKKAIRVVAEPRIQPLARARTRPLTAPAPVPQLVLLQAASR